MRKPPLNPSVKTPLRERLLTVVVPVYNEQEVILEFHRRLSSSLEEADIDRAEIIYVNDGSIDDTLPLLLGLMRADQRVEVLDLSRNFGKEAAMTAGLDHAHGNAVVVIDADLQDPPELIPDMVREWQKGFDVVYMRRLSREGETRMKKATARAFYALMAGVGRVKVPENVGDFRLLSRRAVDALKQMPERTRFMKGLFAWIGFPAKEFSYHRDPRYAGVTKWNYWGLWNLAIEGITSFTIAPLKVASYIGFLTSLTALLYGLFVLARALLFGAPVPGYPSLMVVILFLGGLQLLAIGVVGEYLGRVFIETKQRPLYLVSRRHRSLLRRSCSAESNFQNFENRVSL
ncbi:MAG: glycosyltransferase family 2 protein [Desulforhabdus sp.]|nr:glycosyltransferase family 2 protein [Desulforhabdus sp.]